jgi:hypothetical protein
MLLVYLAYRPSKFKGRRKQAMKDIEHNPCSYQINDLQNHSADQREGRDVNYGE